MKIVVKPPLGDLKNLLLSCYFCGMRVRKGDQTKLRWDRCFVRRPGKGVFQTTEWACWQCINEFHDKTDEDTVNEIKIQRRGPKKKALSDSQISSVEEEGDKKTEGVVSRLSKTREVRSGDGSRPHQADTQETGSDNGREQPAVVVSDLPQKKDGRGSRKKVSGNRSSNRKGTK